MRTKEELEKQLVALKSAYEILPKEALSERGQILIAMNTIKEQLGEEE